MAVARRSLDDAFIQTMRERIDVLKLIERQQAFALATQEELAERPELVMTKDQLKAADSLLDRRVPKLQPIQQTNNLTDNSVTIQVLQFANHTNPGQVATAALPASAVELLGARGQEI